MRKNIYIIIFISLLLTIIHLYLQNRKKIAVISDLIKANDQSINTNSGLEKDRSCRFFEVSMNGGKLKRDLILRNIEGDIITIDEILKGSKLILRYSELNCNTCVDAQLDILNKWSKTFGSENIIIFATSQNPNYIRQFKKINKIKFEIYNLAAESAHVIPDMGNPYYFIYENNSRRINSTFVPTKDLPEQTEKYVNEIANKYFK